MALRLRKFLNHTSDVEAIEMIISSTDKGNNYRELTKGAYEDWENRKINNSELNQLLREAHTRVYG